MERRKDNKGRVLKEGETQRKDLTYMYRYRDRNGDRKYVYSKTLAELREKEALIAKDKALGIYSNNSTLNEIFYRYLEKNSKIKPRTRHKYKTEYERWVSNTWIGRKRLKDITKSDIELFYKELKEKDGFSNGTIKCINKYIKGALEMAFEDDLIRKNYANKCIDPYYGSNKKKAMTKKDTKNFLEFAESVKFGKNYLFLVKLMLLTGLRVGEATGLTWNDVDLKNRIIYVTHQFVQGDESSRTSYHIDETKTKNGRREVPMSNDLYELLVHLKATTYFEAYKFGANVDGYSGFIVHTRTGLPVLTARINEYLKKITKLYNEKYGEGFSVDITCHTLRRTFCSRAAELGIKPHALQVIVGHKSYKTTSEFYIDVDDTFVNEEFFNKMRGIS